MFLSFPQICFLKNWVRIKKKKKEINWEEPIGDTLLVRFQSRDPNQTE